MEPVKAGPFYVQIKPPSLVDGNLVFTYTNAWITTQRLIPQQLTREQFGFGKASFILLHNQRNEATQSFDFNAETDNPTGPESIYGGQYIRVIDDAGATIWFGFIQSISKDAAIDASGYAGSVSALEMGHMAARTNGISARRFDDIAISTGAKINLLRPGKIIVGNASSESMILNIPCIVTDPSLMGTDESNYFTVDYAFRVLLDVEPFRNIPDDFTEESSTALIADDAGAEELIASRVDSVSIDLSNITLRQFLDAIIQPERGYFYYFSDDGNSVGVHVATEALTFDDVEYKQDNAASTAGGDQSPSIIDVSQELIGNGADAVKLSGNSIKVMATWGPGTIDRMWSDDEQTDYDDPEDLGLSSDELDAVLKSPRFANVYSQYTFDNEYGIYITARTVPWDTETGTSYLVCPEVEWIPDAVAEGEDPPVKLKANYKSDRSRSIADSSLFPTNIIAEGVTWKNEDNRSAIEKSNPTYMPVTILFKQVGSTYEQEWVDSQADLSLAYGQGMSSPRFRPSDFGLGINIIFSDGNHRLGRNHYTGSSDAAAVLDWETDMMITATIESAQHVSAIAYAPGYDETTARRMIRLGGDYDFWLVSKYTVMECRDKELKFFTPDETNPLDSIPASDGGTSHHYILKNDFQKMQDALDKIKDYYFRDRYSGKLSFAGDTPPLSLGQGIGTVTIKNPKAAITPVVGSIPTDTVVTYYAAVKTVSYVCSNSSPQVIIGLGEPASISGVNTFSDTKNIRSIGASAPVAIADLQQRMITVESSRKAWIQPGGSPGGTETILTGNILGAYDIFTGYPGLKYSPDILEEAADEWDPDGTLTTQAFEVGIGVAQIHGGSKVLVIHDSSVAREAADYPAGTIVNIWTSLAKTLPVAGEDTTLTLYPVSLI